MPQRTSSGQKYYATGATRIVDTRQDGGPVAQGNTVIAVGPTRAGALAEAALQQDQADHRLPAAGVHPDLPMIHGTSPPRSRPPSPKGDRTPPVPVGCQKSRVSCRVLVDQSTEGVAAAEPA